MNLTLPLEQQTDALDRLGFVRGGLRILLRFEGLAALGVALTAYSQAGAGWRLSQYFLSPIFPWWAIWRAKARVRPLIMPRIVSYCRLRCSQRRWPDTLNSNRTL